MEFWANTFSILKAEPTIPRNWIQDVISQIVAKITQNTYPVTKGLASGQDEKGPQGRRMKTQLLSSLAWLYYSIVFISIILLSQEAFLHKIKVANNFIVHPRNLSKDQATQESISIRVYIPRCFRHLTSLFPEILNSYIMIVTQIPIKSLHSKTHLKLDFEITIIQALQFCSLKCCVSG